MIISNTSTQKYFFWFSIVLILLFTFLEPSGTAETSFVIRLFIWILQIGILVPSLIAFHIVLQKSHFFNNLNDWLKILISGLLGCAFFLPFALGIDYIFGIDDWSKIRTLEQAQEIIYEEIGRILMPVLLTWAGMNAPRILQLNFSNQPSNIADKKATINPANTNNSAFISKFAKLIGTDIIYIMSELHYIRVVTSGGETLVLNNLKDAIAELQLNFSGIQTHRSFWVAYEHIKFFKEKDGQANLTLSMGKIIPVSRRKIGEVKKFLRNRKCD